MIVQAGRGFEDHLLSLQGLCVGPLWIFHTAAGQSSTANDALRTQYLYKLDYLLHLYFTLHLRQLLCCNNEALYQADLVHGSSSRVHRVSQSSCVVSRPLVYYLPEDLSSFLLSFLLLSPLACMPAESPRWHLERAWSRAC